MKEIGVYTYMHIDVLLVEYVYQQVQSQGFVLVMKAEHMTVPPTPCLLSHYVCI